MIASGSSVPPPRPANLAPIARSGSTTRPIGRRRSEASPSRIANSVAAREERPRRAGRWCRSCRSRGCPRARRARRRPATRPGSRRGRRARRSARRVAPRAATIPRRRADVLAVAGAPRSGSRPRASSASRSARCEIDLSPGRRGRAAQARGGTHDEDVVAGVVDARRSAGRAVAVRRPPPAPPARSEVAVEVLDVAVDGGEGGHHRVEHREVELLLAVGQRLVRVAGGPRP